MKKTIASILCTLAMTAFMISGANAQGTDWKQYLEAGLSTMKYKELSEKMSSASKDKTKASLDSILYSTVSRETLKKSRKYLRAVLALFRKGETKMPTKEDLDQLSGSLALVWHDEIKEAQETTQDKPKAVKLQAIKKVQLQMRQDSLVVLQLCKKVLGEKDPDYIKIKNANDRLEQSINKY